MSSFVMIHRTVMSLYSSTRFKSVSLQVFMPFSMSFSVQRRTSSSFLSSFPFQKIIWDCDFSRFISNFLVQRSSGWVWIQRFKAASLNIFHSRTPGLLKLRQAPIQWSRKERKCRLQLRWRPAAGWGAVNLAKATNKYH